MSSEETDYKFRTLRSTSIKSGSLAQRSVASSQASYTDSHEDKIIKRGRLAIMICEKNNRKPDFDTYYMQLTDKCHLKVRNISNKEGMKSHEYIINQCCIMDDACFFRLDASKATETKTASVDIICRCKDKYMRNEWLISIESCLRRQVTSLFNEIDSLRAYMEVFFLNKDTKIDSHLQFEGCFCFYHKRVLRIKDLDPIRTLSFKVKNIDYEVKGRPLCFLIRTAENLILCRTDSPDTHLLWSTYIQKDLDIKKKDTVAGEYEGLLLTKREGSEQDFMRTFCKYTANTAMLDVTYSSGASDFMKVMRCIVVPPKTDFKYHFSLQCQIKSGSSYSTSYLNCRAATKEDADVWISIISPPIKKVIKLLKLIISEIEIRRTFKHAYSSSQSYECLTYEEINDLITNVDNAKSIIRDVVKCPIMTLEKAVRSIFRFLPRPVIPFETQNDLCEIGNRIRKRKKFENQKMKIMDLYVKLPAESQEILKILSGHVSRIIAHNKDKCPEITVQEAEIIIWSRLSTNLLKVYDQTMPQCDRDDLLDCVGHVLPLMIAKTDTSEIEETRKGHFKSFCRPL